MPLEDFLYSIGETVERTANRVGKAIKRFLLPKPSDELPRFPISDRVASKYTPHEKVSLHLQLVLLAYLGLSFVLVGILNMPLVFLIASLVYLLYLRYALIAYGSFLIDPLPYRRFYLGISIISFAVFLGYTLLKTLGNGARFYYPYLAVVVFIVIAFWWHFKRTFGRDYTYGVVEELKGDLVRVFIHDDISANVKPGLYWLPAVPDAEPGRVVKVLVEERPFRSARPVRIIEVYLPQSSQSSTEPKKETE